MEAFTCNTPTLPAQDALRERLERIENRQRALRELEQYLEAIRPFQRPIEVEFA
jgi:hypothetical protein